jgi:hypothetical protein
MEPPWRCSALMALCHLGLRYTARIGTKRIKFMGREMREMKYSEAHDWI